MVEPAAVELAADLSREADFLSIGTNDLMQYTLVVDREVPRNHIQAALHHPMVMGVQLWALAHLLANGTLPAALLFGAFLAWALLSFLAARRRDRVEGHVYAAGRPAMTLATVAIGAGLWAGFAFWLHQRLIGVAPLG